VTIDAMCCQCDIAKKIMEKKAITSSRSKETKARFTRMSRFWRPSGPDLLGDGGGGGRDRALWRKSKRSLLPSTLKAALTVVESYSQPWHIANMAMRPRKSYRVVPQKDSTYGVEVSDGASLPTTVKSFATEAETNAWITEQTQTELRAAVGRLVKAARNELKRRGK
jgi:hypothetical protein